MVRWFKKEIPSNPLYLRSGRALRFQKTKSGLGVLASNQEETIFELQRMAARRQGGLSEINAAEYACLVEGDGAREFRAVKRNGISAERPGIDQLYIKWRIARGRFRFKPVSTPRLKLGRIIHCLERHALTDPENIRRVRAAWDSWIALYKTGRVVPCHVWQYPRDARALGDTRELPYLRDILQSGIERSEPGDLIMLSNDDTILHAELPAEIYRRMENLDAISSFRLNFPKNKVPSTTEKLSRICARGDPCLGRDLFVFRQAWLSANLGLIPDFCLGESEWDLCLAVLVRQLAGVMSSALNIAEPLPPCELSRGFVLHEVHERSWTDPRYASSPAKIHNNVLLAEFYSDNDFEHLIGKLL